MQSSVRENLSELDVPFPMLGSPALDPLVCAAKFGRVDGDRLPSCVVTARLLEQMRDEYHAELARKEGKIEELQRELAERDRTLSWWRQRHLVMHSLWSSMTAAPLWKLLAPLRFVRRLLKPRGFAAGALIPWQGLQPAPSAGPAAWTVRGPNPQWLVPCLLPAGWTRVRLRLTSARPGRLELYADSGDGFNPAECVESIEYRAPLKLDFFVRFCRPVVAMRLDLVDADGEIHLEEMRAEPVPLPRALLHALRGKIRLLRSMDLTGGGLGNGILLLLRGRLAEAKDKFWQGLERSSIAPVDWYDANSAYQRWRQLNTLTNAGRKRMRAEATLLADPPFFSVILPVFNVEETYLRLAVESVRRQIYPHWELCIADDASSAGHVRAVLEEYAREDERIKVVFRAERGNISAASNSALALARGDYIALLDHDDELAEHALFQMARAIGAERRLDMLYSDEDKLEADGRHIDPFFKPDWSPEFFLACMYTCHLGVYRTALVRELGGFRSAYDGAQDYDLVLRLAARRARIRHVPGILYHWRKLPSSAASGDMVKTEATAAARRALAAYQESIRQPGWIEPGPLPGVHRARFHIAGQPRVSIIIPSACRLASVRGQQSFLLLPCLNSIRRQSTYGNVEILVMHPLDIAGELSKSLARLGAAGIPYDDPFNWSDTMNRGAARARGDYLLFLNDDMEVLSPDWIECLLEFAQQEEIGAVGAKLLFPDDRLQHVGVTLLDGVPGHPFYRYPSRHRGYFGSAILHGNYSAVTGACLMTRAEVFRAVGGFDPELPLNYNDVDYCLKVQLTGRRIVYTPYAQLIHHEAMTKAGVFAHELEVFRERWRDKWPRDPYYNPNLSHQFFDYRIALDEKGPGRQPSFNTL